MSLYNDGVLDPIFYDEDGLIAEMRGQATKTQHNWGFKLSPTEINELEELAGEVDRKTRKPTGTSQ